MFFLKNSIIVIDVVLFLYKIGELMMDVIICLYLICVVCYKFFKDINNKNEIICLSIDEYFELEDDI